MRQKTELSQYDNSWYSPGGNFLKRALWYFVNSLFFLNPLNPFSGMKVFLLRLFGAKIGKGVVIKQHVNIKYPWKLKMGDYVWIGEKVWIDNLDMVTIADNSSVSQGAMLLCGNHNYKKTTFDLMVGRIDIEEGCWISAKSIVCPGVVCKSHSVLMVNSVATKDLDRYSIYQGNPAVKVRVRVVN